MTDHELSPLQHTEQATTDVPAPLTEYVNEQVMQLESLHNHLRKNQKADMRVESQYARYQTVQQELSQGRYNTLSEQLQTEAAEQEAEISTLQQQMRPRGEMQGDQQFFYLRDQIQEGEDTLVKASEARMDEQSRSWITKTIDVLRHDQKTQTERGRIRARMDVANTELSNVNNLRELIPQSPARPQAISTNSGSAK